VVPSPASDDGIPF